MAKPLALLMALAIAGCEPAEPAAQDKERLDVVPDQWTVVIETRSGTVKTKNVKEIRYFQDNWVRVDYTDKSFTTYSREAVISIRVYPGD